MFTSDTLDIKFIPSVSTLVTTLKNHGMMQARVVHYLTAKTLKCLCSLKSMVKDPAVGFMHEMNWQLWMSLRVSFVLSYLQIRNKHLLFITS